MKLLNKLLKSDQSAYKSNVTTAATAAAASTKLKRSHRESRHNYNKNRNELYKNTKHSTVTTTTTNGRRNDNRATTMRHNENRSKISYNQIGVVDVSHQQLRPLLPQFGGIQRSNDRFIYGGSDRDQQQMICDQLFLNRRHHQPQESSNFYQNNDGGGGGIKKVDLNEHYQQTVCLYYLIQKR